ncbi:MAG: hypothetical protein JNL01_13480 [Bdellovibrionales bacterium]|nr:hypothetical protein [Bdellovibrionales bacterium]
MMKTFVLTLALIVGAASLENVAMAKKPSKAELGQQIEQSFRKRKGERRGLLARLFKGRKAKGQLKGGDVHAQKNVKGGDIHAQKKQRGGLFRKKAK